MRGRYPLGVEAVEGLEGSAQAKERMQVILATLAGQCRIHEACAQLGISQQRFQQIRDKLLQGALASQELKAAGRKPRALSAAEERIAELEAEVAELHAAVRVAQTREEIALILPQVGPEAGAEKKTTAKARKRRGRPRGTRRRT